MDVAELQKARGMILTIVSIIWGLGMGFFRGQMHAEMFADGKRYPGRDFYSFWNLHKVAVTSLVAAIGCGLSLHFVVLLLATLCADDVMFSFAVNRRPGVAWYNMSQDNENGSSYDRFLLSVFKGNERTAFAAKVMATAICGAALALVSILLF